MADKAARFPDNAPGKYYVDDTCILCSACESIAPDFFKVADDEEHDIVYKQPVTAEEIALCEEALEACPVESIGNDGDEE
jgi:ferredoxin